jgi:hypothetical protein
MEIKEMPIQEVLDELEVYFVAVKNLGRGVSIFQHDTQDEALNSTFYLDKTRKSKVFKITLPEGFMDEDDSNK